MRTRSDLKLIISKLNLPAPDFFSDGKNKHVLNRQAVRILNDSLREQLGISVIKSEDKYDQCEMHVLDFEKYKKVYTDHQETSAMGYSSIGQKTTIQIEEIEDPIKTANQFVNEIFQLSVEERSNKWNQNKMETLFALLDINHAAWVLDQALNTLFTGKDTQFAHICLYSEKRPEVHELVRIRNTPSSVNEHPLLELSMKLVKKSLLEYSSFIASKGHKRKLESSDVENPEKRIKTESTSMTVCSNSMFNQPPSAIGTESKAEFNVGDSLCEIHDLNAIEMHQLQPQSPASLVDSIFNFDKDNNDQVNFANTDSDYLLDHTDENLFDKMTSTTVPSSKMK